MGRSAGWSHELTGRDRCNGQVVFAVSGDDKRFLAFGFDAVLFHHAPYALVAHSDAACHQLFPNLGPAALNCSITCWRPASRACQHLCDACARGSRWG